MGTSTNGKKGEGNKASKKEPNWWVVANACNRPERTRKQPLVKMEAKAT
jgi:hypothetical protein